MATEQPTERTPLIEHNITNTTTTTLPSILDLEKDIHSDSEYPAIHGIVNRQVDALTFAPTIALSLKLILCLRFLSGSYFHLDKENWVDPCSAERDVGDLVLQLWKDLQGSAFSEALLDEALWTQFPLEGEKEDRISLIEVLLTDQVHGPASIQLDDRLALSLLRSWKSGRPRSTNDDRQISALLKRIEGFATPRILHLVDLAFNLAYFVILLLCLNHPTESFPNDYRFPFIAVYAMSRILRDSGPSASRSTFVLTLASFLSVFPAMPRLRDSSYTVLLLCFFMHTIQLLLPASPSIFLLTPQLRPFTVSVMLGNLINLILLPALTFFIPIIFVLLFLLMMSIAGSVITATGGGFYAFDLFIFTVWFSGFLFTCLASYMTLSYSSLQPMKFHHPDVPVSWNLYGPNVGVSLRRRLCHLTVQYSTPYFFPAPLNLIPLILVRLPRRVLLLFREKHVAPYLKSTVEPVIWRILAVPLVFVFGIAWLWS